MEVHHHTKNHGGGWKGHLLEFAMLFAAVTLGFFAENLREHYVERHRAVAFLDSIAADLDADIVNIEFDVGAEPFAVHGGERGHGALRQWRIPRADGGFLLRHPGHILRGSRSCRRSTAIEQLRASGGVRLIANRKVLDAVQRYQVSL